MRYRIGEDPTSGTTTTDDMILLTVIIGLIVGFILTWLAWHGRQTWLLVWSVGLVIASVAYLAWTGFAS